MTDPATDPPDQSGTQQGQTRSRAFLALLLIAPAPTIGVLSAMVFAPGAVGQAVYATCRIWLFALPALWWLFVERRRPSWSPANKGGLGVSAILGVVMGVVIVITALIFGPELIDRGLLRSVTRRIGLGSPLLFAAAAGWWILVNSLLEEYVYRWFVLLQCRRLMGTVPAVVLSSLIFTAHHVFALDVYLEAGPTALASLGVFSAGVVWSWCYIRFSSIWPGWLSHAIADAAIFGAGWFLVFGPTG